MTEHILHDLNPLKRGTVYCVAQHMSILVNIQYVFEKFLYALHLFYEWSSVKFIDHVVHSLCSLLVAFICLNPSVTESSGLESPPWLCICLPFAFGFILSMPQLHEVPTNLEF